MQTGTGTVTWTATSTRPWLQVSPTSGTGPATLSLVVVPDPNLPAAGIADGAIILTYSGAANAPGPVLVRLNLIAMGQSSSPIGTVDTPLDNATGVTGAVPFTGWALDDVEVRRVNVCRQPVGGESVPVSDLCNNTPQVFLGSAVFVDGARPDVESAFPAYPLNARGGWGFMVLTNMLPNQGNGSYQFVLYAQDREARFTLLGTRTMTCNNAQATKPFGTIDTPEQGGTVSGTFINFGWALTPQPKIIPTNGSTITVLIDGVARGNATYNQERSDIETLFPNYRNTEGTNGAVGFRAIDSSIVANGLHTISWIVTDSNGISEGIGSRFFRVANSTTGPTTGGGAATMAVEEASLNIDAIEPERAPLWGRRGWDLGGEWTTFPASASGRVLVRSEEIDRIELALESGSGQTVSGYLRSAAALTPLPSGSRLNPATGRFTWTPGPGFVGTYDLVFVRSAAGVPVARRDVRVVLRPKSSGFVGPQIVIDTPRSQQDVGQPFVVAGWAADLSAADGSSGVTGIHAWAYPLSGGAPIFVGAATYGGARPDVAAVHGEDFRTSGFTLPVYGLPPGNYDLAVFAWSTVLGNFAPARVVRVTVR
jgi:hypothetical protein